jgi:succinate dehydrogenase / fumarate reductase cytochrome b subunit
MNWILRFFTSSLGRKVIMSLTGLFLVSFLLVHLSGNFLLLKGDGGEAFNIYTEFMSTNPLIQFVSKGLYLFIILHTIQGLILWSRNRKAKGQTYTVKTSANSTWASKNMALLGTLVLFFLFIHMGDFWFKIKFQPDTFEMVQYAGMTSPIKDAYARVQLSFQNPVIVVSYILGFVALAFHLLHGFQSAFQTLGLRHKKYTPLVELIGRIIGIAIPAGFALITLFFFFK